MNDKYVQLILNQIEDLTRKLDHCPTTRAEDILFDMIDNLKDLIIILLRK